MTLDYYTRGLDVLRELAGGTNWEPDFTVHEDALRANLREEHRYGSTQLTRSERTRLIEKLNALTLQQQGFSLSTLCEILQFLHLIEEKTQRRRADDIQVGSQIREAIVQGQLEQEEIARMTAVLKDWVQHVKQAGLPLSLQVRDALDLLTAHDGSDNQYFVLALRVIPGVLTADTELASRYPLSLRDLWEKKAGPAEGAKGEGRSPGEETIYGLGKRWAVLVGVNEYEDLANYGRLHVCVSDVEATYDLLITGGFDPERIRLLTDNTSEPPTRTRIIAALQSVANQTEPDDLLLFYYSGHGDEEKGESYLVAREGHRLVLSDSAVPISRVKQIIEGAPARAKVIILDACHSGADIKAAKPMTEAFIRRVFEEAEGLVILASCKQNQISYEWRKNERSVFTHYLLEALSGEADGDEKGFVTVHDASRYVTDGVKKWAAQHNATQTPTLQSTVVGDIILTGQPRQA